jgi:hypothetical protein
MSDWGNTEEERRRRLEAQAMQDFRNAMGGSGGSSRHTSLNIPFWFFGAAFATAELIDVIV